MTQKVKCPHCQSVVIPKRNEFYYYIWFLINIFNVYSSGVYKWKKCPECFESLEEEEYLYVCPKCNEGKMSIESKENKLFKCAVCHSVIELNELVSNNIEYSKKKLMIGISLFIIAALFILYLMNSYMKDFPAN